jgi:hypothetical protein
MVPSLHVFLLFFGSVRFVANYFNQFFVFNLDQNRAVFLKLIVVAALDHCVQLIEGDLVADIF